MNSRWDIRCSVSPDGSVVASLPAIEKVLETRITVAQEKEQVMSPEKQVRSVLGKMPACFEVPAWSLPGALLTVFRPEIHNWPEDRMMRRKKRMFYLAKGSSTCWCRTENRVSSPILYATLVYLSRSETCLHLPYPASVSASLGWALHSHSKPDPDVPRTPPDNA